MKLAHGNESKEDGRRGSKTTRDRASKEAKALRIYARENEADWYVSDMVRTVKGEGGYELTIWGSNLVVIRERSFAIRATCLESQARSMLPKNERGTAPEKTLWSNFRGYVHVKGGTR